MKFIIDKAKPLKDNGYYIEVEFMHGDADGDTYEEFGPFFKENFDEVEGFIKFLDFVLSRECPYDLRRNDTSRNQWPEWCLPYVGWDNCWEVEDEIKWPMFTLYDEWPGDHTCDYSYRASIHGYRVFFIDIDGREYEVKVTK